ncbi:MAG: copper amine oxidase N-terminal domain-containing protein [Peptostreptococcaceae bacterium]|nr:copper amine oxidase N-terminal domain-containing protein [Peptostreptococcaceae bacterium]
MKRKKEKRIFKTVSALLAALLMQGGAAYGEEGPDIYVDGALIKSEAAAFVENGRTMVPLRMIANALDLETDWNASTSTVTLKDGKNNRVELTIGKTTAYKNKEPMRMDAAAALREGRTYVPLKFVASGFSRSVSYDKENRNVIIGKNYIKPVVEDYLEYEYNAPAVPEAVSEAKSGAFLSMAVAMRNPALQKGLRMRTGGAFLSGDGQEYIELRKEVSAGKPQYLFRLHTGGHIQIDGQIPEELYEDLEDGYLEAVIFDLGADGEQDLLVITGDEEEFRILPFFFGLQRKKGESGLIYTMRRGSEGYFEGDAGIHYEKDGSLRIYEGNGGGYRRLTKRKDGSLELSGELQW